MWLAQAGRQLIADLLRHARKDPAPFYVAYDSMIQFLMDERNLRTVEEELKQRRVPELGFWDVMVDFVLIDSFEDLSRPPSAVLAVTRNMFLSQSMKESTLTTVIWSMLKAKRARLSVPELGFWDVMVDFVLIDSFEDLSRPPSAVLAVTRNMFLSQSMKESTLTTVIWSMLKAKRARLSLTNGFISHFYDISEVISPVITLGFLGTDEHMRDLCQYFKVPELGFWDVMVDFVLIDSFEDLSRPPSAVLAVTRNMFLSQSMKESTLTTVIWSMLKAKRARLSLTNGFISHFYDISEVISPVITLGFLGTDEHMRDLCQYFKEQTCSFIVDIFNVNRVRYTGLKELSEDVWMILRTRIEMVQTRLSTELLPVA
uniref:F-box domain-containing protein n=1 Tax=Ascaris lumbricoides TaxID=6252 RepID=A0A0M3IW24_ASCLU